MPLAAHAQQKVIVLGFDGVDARYTEQWMNEGRLPNLARLRAAGTFRPLRPTLPAQTPVSWSTFSTGIDPGRTGIFDFLRRDPKTYMPLFAAFDEIEEPFLLGRNNAAAAAAIVFVVIALIALFFRRVARVVMLVVAVALGTGAFFATAKYIPKTKPNVINRRQGTPFWEVAASAGKKARVVHIPVTFPAHDFPAGEMLSGL
ncbi:MAG TPA: alkaline phosphatase family protein, partial [Thermoanaerobaculia bacterium]|nr:alkaline phosphatase family protein [Thermoanaerobaculia bacterium]